MYIELLQQEHRKRHFINLGTGEVVFKYVY